MQYEVLSAEPRYLRNIRPGAHSAFRPRRGLASRGMALSACPSCDSEFLQPLRCEPKDDDEVLVELRCPDCMTHLQARVLARRHGRARPPASARREEIVVAYERSVTESMEALAACLVPALDLDLIADDFAVLSSRRPRLPAGDRELVAVGDRRPSPGSGCPRRRGRR